jgi:tetratricopeptide (TPR) repeat protein
MNAWWGDVSRRSPIRRANAFSAARAGKADSVNALLAIATDPEESPFARANALGYLSTFPADPRVAPIFRWALGETDPLLRQVAALRMPRAQDSASDLINSLRDKNATVRLAAAVSLVAAGVKELPKDFGPAFEEAKSLYATRADLNSDDATQQFAAARFFLLTGDARKASVWFENTLRMDPQMPVQYFLGAALSRMGKIPEARESLNRVKRSDPQYQRAQELLRQIQGR